MLGINYNGDPHPLQKQHNIYVPTIGGDVYGVRRIVPLLQANKYDMVFFINDAWIIMQYLAEMRKAKIDIPVVSYIPIDAKHIKPHFIEPLNTTAHVIAYTEFGLNEMKLGGLNVPHSVIPHGIDTTTFHKVPVKEAREECGLDPDWFITLSVARNQNRKRLDLLMYFFSEWVHRTNKPDNVKLYYHGALRDLGWDLLDLAAHWKIDNRFIITSHNLSPDRMIPVEKLKYIYSSADVFVHPCASEGFGLPIAEAMACGTPCLLPYSSALAEWPKGGVEYYEVYDDVPYVNTGGVNTIMDTPKLSSFIEKMEKLYQEAQYRKELGNKGYKLVTASKYQWKNIASQFHEVFKTVIK